MGTIVCAVDDSREAGEALRVAGWLSGQSGLRLVVAHVEAPLRARLDVLGSAGQRGRQLLDRQLATQGVNGAADKRVEIGERANEIARVAEEEAAGLIVLGSPRRRWWRKTSSLSDDLAATATCPVVVVPPPARA